ncbi:MAG: glycosyltransferase [archaeon]
MLIKRSLPIVLFINLFYLIWVFPYLNGIAGIIFYVAELGFFSLLLVFGFCHWEGKHVFETGIKAKGTVDVFITCLNEPVAMIEKTLKASVNIDYGHKKVFLLDDGNRNELKKLAEKYAAIYLARERHINEKAGNLNNGLMNSDSEFIFTLDADQVPDKEVLKKTLGYFTKSEKIAFVTTRQRFDVHKQDFNKDHMFYEHMQTGKNADACSISCGSGVIYRRSALEKIGGFKTWNLVEDVYTSFELHRHGFTSLYINKAYTTGLAPQDLKNIYKQRGTWAVDSLRLLFKKNPLFAKGLSFNQRIHYFEIGYIYLVAGVFFPILFCLPIVSLLTNVPLLFVGVEFIFIRLLGLLSIVWFYSRLNEGSEGTRFWTGLWPIFSTAALLAAVPGKIKYRVTSKAETSKRRIKLILPQLTILSLGIISIYFNVYAYGLSNNTLANSLWVFVVAWWMWPVIVKGFSSKFIHTPTLHTQIEGEYT